MESRYACKRVLPRALSGGMSAANETGRQIRQSQASELVPAWKRTSDANSDLRRLEESSRTMANEERTRCSRREAVGQWRKCRVVRLNASPASPALHFHRFSLCVGPSAINSQHVLPLRTYLPYPTLPYLTLVLTHTQILMLLHPHTHMSPTMLAYIPDASSLSPLALEPGSFPSPSWLAAKE